MIGLTAACTAVESRKLAGDSMADMARCAGRMGGISPAILPVEVPLMPSSALTQVAVHR
jgi:hypothetical protein